jgi:hypothetical protein
MRPIKLVVATVLFTMLALVALRADAQNGLGSSLDESATAASSSGADSETRAGSSGDSTLDSRWLQFESSSNGNDGDYDIQRFTDGSRQHDSENNREQDGARK